MKLWLPDTRIVRGKWTNIRVWANQADKDAFDRGEFVLPIWAQAEQPNGITDQGIHYLLEAGFRGGSAISTWYALLIDNAGFTGVDASDVMSSHTGWSESTDYTESVRQTLSFGAAASRTINASVSFTMNATKTIQGIAVTSDNTKGGTTGTLWSTALFSTPPGLISGNVLTANYSLSD